MLKIFLTEAVEVPELNIEDDQALLKLLNDLPGDKAQVKFYTARNGHTYGKEFMTDLYQKSKLDKVLFGKLLYAIKCYKITGQISAPYAKHVQGKIFEFRAQVGTNHARLLFFTIVNNTVIILNGFKKDQNKIDKPTLKQAEDLLKQYMEDNPDD